MSDLNPQEQQFFESGGEVSPEPAETTAEPVVSEQPAVTEPAAQDHAEQKMVPLAALHEARSQNKEYKAALARAEADRQMWEKRWAEINDRLAPQKPAVPEFAENPAEHLRVKQERIEQELASERQAREQQTQEQRFTAWYQTQAAQFAQSTPDFPQAYNAFLQQRQAELADTGMTQQQVVAKLRQEEQLLAVTAAQLGMNPAQLVYQTAMAKGYKPASAATAPTQQDHAATAQAAQNKLQTVADGIKSGKSLSQVPGRPTSNLTAEYVANMSDSEWREFSKDWEGNMGKLVA